MLLSPLIPSMRLVNMNLRLFNLILSLTLLGTLCACGQRGALYLPPTDTPATTPQTNPAADLTNSPAAAHK
jgi:predicted small lipoprotein YifL